VAVKLIGLTFDKAILGRARLRFGRAVVKAVVKAMLSYRLEASWLLMWMRVRVYVEQVTACDELLPSDDSGREARGDGTI